MNEIVKWLLGSDPSELFGGNWRFGFVAGYSNYVNLLLMVLLLGMVYLIVRSYRREGDTRPGVKASLATIRILVCLLLLAVLFRPAIIERTAETVYSSVVLLLDDSRSMGFTDRYSDANEAAALSAIMGKDQAALEDVTRTDIVRRMLGRQGGLMEKLSENHPLIVLRFSTDKQGREAYTRPLGRLMGPSAGGRNIQTADGATTRPTTMPDTPAEILDRLTHSGYETDIPGAMRDAIEDVLGRRVAGIVVVSDGQMTTRSGQDRLSDVIAYANQRGRRVYPVLVGDPTPPKNVSVTGLQAPREVRRGSHATFSVVLAHRNLAGQEVQVKLFRKPVDSAGNDGDWANTGVSAPVRLGSETAAGSGRSGTSDVAAHGVQTVELTVVPDKIGKFVYRAVVEPTADERNTDDNEAEAPVDVSDEKIRVLLVSGDAGWEFQYIRNFLHRQPDLYRLSVWQQNADPEVNQLASTGMKINHLPRTFADLAGDAEDQAKPGYDVVILCDPQPTVDGFDAQFVKLLRKFVQDRGGGLCYIAGSKYSDGLMSDRGDFGDLVTMLPVVMAANTGDTVARIMYSKPRAWPVLLTDYGLDSLITRLGGSAADSAKLWQVLPGIYWSHPVLKAKQLSRVLAVSSNPARHTDRDEPEPLLVTGAFGKGRVLYVGFDETWRWRYMFDGKIHREFWDNVVRYLSSLRSKDVIITAGGELFSAGERITVQVEAYDRNGDPVETKTFDVEMIDTATGKGQTIACKAVPDKPGRYEATFRASRTGTFKLTALTSDPKAAEKVQAKTIRIELPKAEAIRPEADRATMENLASRPEHFRTIDHVDDLARLIPQDRKVAVREVPRELWDSNLALLLIVLLLSVEWILRKKYNLA